VFPVRYELNLYIVPEFKMLWSCWGVSNGGSLRYFASEQLSQHRVLPVVLCGSDTWSLTLRENHIWRVCDKELSGEWLEIRGASLFVLFNGYHQGDQIKDD
jgi:hypothetical protein